MKRLLISTTALAVALSGMTPVPVLAQDSATQECVEGQPCPDDKAAKKAAKKEEREKEKAADAGSAEDEAAKAARKAERQTEKAAEKAAAEEAAPAKSPAEAPVAEDPTATSDPAPTSATPADAQPEQKAEETAEEKAERKAARKAEKDAAEAAEQTEPSSEGSAGSADAEAGDAAATEMGGAMTKAEKKAAKKAAKEEQDSAENVPAPTPTPEAEAALSDILGSTAEPVDGAAEVPVAAAAAATTGQDGATEAEPVTTAETVLTEENTRSSSEEFRARDENDKDRERKREKFREREDDEDDGLSNFEKFGLVALGALAVGMILKNGDRVVENTGDRVVVSRSDGTYQVWRDDDTLIRQPGSTVRTETFNDGSTRTTVTRDDGSRIVTIRDVSGRVLRRALIDVDGRETLLIDDLAPVQPIDVTTLPRRPEITLSAANDTSQLEAALAAARAGEAARGFSLAQVRDVREVRALAPRIEVAPITFASGSAAIDPSEAEKLAELGGLVARMVRERPNELFLIEGHTDAVGDAASNLALSDRRAESVALALTEYFEVPPENLVVQGYGEGDLLVPTTAAEPLNRRVAVRVITPLLAAAR